MENKTIANWLIATLVLMIVGVVLKVDSELLGVFVIANWVFEIFAITKLNK